MGGIGAPPVPREVGGGVECPGAGDGLCGGFGNVIGAGGGKVVRFT
jgi:hypothetical protein